ncbi:MAG: ABC transporter ATP-binding protein [Christensenellales bacterium]
MIRIDSLSKCYGKNTVKAVDNLHLHIRPGEIFGFIGPNGAGKTTTIRMMAGILTPDEGDVIIKGHSIRRDALAAKMDIGLVPDEAHIYERLTGMEYLEFIASVYHTPNDRKRRNIEKYLEVFELAQVSGQRISSYSRGMRQKLLITSALIHEPSVWLLDEPMTGMDPRSALALKQEMHVHCNAGNTVFFSTHVLEVAEKLCDRLGIIVGGKLVAVGTMEELRQRETDGAGTSLEEIFMGLTEKSEATQ